MGRHYLQIPGPTTEPDSVLRAMSAVTIDHRGPTFGALGRRLLEAVKPVFGTTDPVVIYPSSGTGAWEAALVNTLSPGDRVLAFETGHFSTLWVEMATRLGLQVDLVPGDWRRGVRPEDVQERLAADGERSIKAVCCVHNETSTGVTSRIGAVREAIDAADHPALLLVDSISGIGSVPFEHDAWRVDVTITGSQKGLMLPPGIGFNVVSAKAREASRTAGFARSYWDWEPILAANENGYWPYTPPTNLLFGLEESLRLLAEEGLPQVFARHERAARATRAAVRAWGLEILCQDEREYSPVLTGIVVPEGHDADHVRAVILERFDLSLGAGLGKVAKRVFRIGHLGLVDPVSAVGTLGAVQLGLQAAGVPLAGDGVAAALAEFGEG